VAGVVVFQRTMYDGFQKKFFQTWQRSQMGLNCLDRFLVNLPEERVQNNSACESLADKNNVTLKD